MTVPFTEPVQNFTELSLWEILDIKKANFSVSSFSELNEAYSETPLKFTERTIVQIGSTPKRIRYYDENGDFTEDDYYPSNEPNPYRDAATLDKVSTIIFDQNKEATLSNPEDIRYELSDGAVRLYNSGEVTVYLDSNKPIGAIQFENLANYHWDYPEIVVKLYVDNAQTYLGGFRVPYGFGVVMKYNLDNKEELNLSKGWWTWSMFIVDYSVIKKVATSEGQFASVEAAYLGLFGDEGEGDERLFYPAMLKQDVNGWTQFEFTGSMQFKSKDKNNGVVGDKVMQLSPTRIDLLQQPYYGNYKLQTRTNNPVYRTVSKNDLIGDDGNSIQEWITENPDYTPVDFVDRLFSSKVLGHTNWEASITLSNETFNGTLPYGYTQFRVFRTGGSSRSFMYLHNKESHRVLYAPYRSGVAPVFRNLAYTDEIESVVNNTLNDLVNPPEPDEVKTQYIFDDDHITKGYQNKHTAINPFSYDDEYNRIGYDYRNETSSGPRNAFQILSIKDKSIGYMMIKEDRLKDMMSASGLYVPPNLQSVYGARIPTGTIVRMGGTGSAPNNAANGGKYDYRGLAIPNTNPNTGAVIDPNRNSNGVFLDVDGNLVSGMNNAVSHFRTERELEQAPLGNAGEDMNFALKRGVIIFKKDGDKSDAFFVEDSSSPWYIMAVELNTNSTTTEQYTSVIYKNDSEKSASNLKLYPNPFIAALDGERIITSNEATALIETNNDEILTPDSGSDFELTDSSFDAGYGLDGNVTYIGISKTEGQSAVLINHLDQSKCYFIHKSHSTTSGFMILHESLVAEIYNKDLVGINEVVMLFGPKSKGRLGKSNQKVPDGYIWNWNGEAVPESVSANEINPGNWLDKDGNPTTTWSSSVLSACFSVGTLNNVGSAALVRGDVIFDEATTTTSMTISNESEFFVMPVKTGGGTFSDIKLFQLFMGRRSGTQSDFDAYTFDKSADAIGTLLRISYDTAVQVESGESAQRELFKMAVATQNSSGTSLTLNLTGE